MPFEPGQGGGSQRLTGGRLQMLAKVEADSNGQTYVHLIPHHYKHQISVRPRSPLKKQLDGSVFNSLAIRLPVRQNKFIVLGLYRPALPKKPGETEPEAPEKNGEAPASASPIPAAEPNRSAGSAGGKADSDSERAQSRLKQMQQNARQRANPQRPRPRNPRYSPRNSPRPRNRDRQKPERVDRPLALPDRMGSTLFAGSRLGKPRQLLLIIAVEPLQ